MPPELIGDGDDGTALCVDDRATVEDGWGDGPDEGLLWYEPNSPYPRVLPEGKTDNFVGSSERTDWCLIVPKKREMVRENLQEITRHLNIILLMSILFI